MKVAQSGWSGQICDLLQSVSFFSFISFLLTFFLSFLFLPFCFLQHAPRSHFFTYLDNLYAKMHVPAKDVVIDGIDNIRLQLGVKVKPQNLSKMGGNRHFVAKSAK